MRSASCPCRIVSASVVNSPMSAPGIAQHKIVPTSMIAAFIRSVRFINLLYTLVLARAVIVPDERPDALDDAVCRQV